MNPNLEDRKNELAFNVELDEKLKAHQAKLEGEFIEDVLIRESKSRGDRVFIINKLPKDLLYKAEKKLVPTGEQQYLKPSGEVWEQTLPGIEHAPEDNSYIFFPNNRESKSRLEAIDNYIKSRWPHNRSLPVREFYAVQPGITSSPAKPRSMVLRVDLPMSPPASSSEFAASGQPSLINETTLAEIKKQAIEEAKKEVMDELRKEKSAQLAKAREAKAKKKANQA